MSYMHILYIELENIRIFLQKDNLKNEKKKSAHKVNLNLSSETLHM